MARVAHTIENEEVLWHIPKRVRTYCMARAAHTIESEKVLWHIP